MSSSSPTLDKDTITLLELIRSTAQQLRADLNSHFANDDSFFLDGDWDASACAKARQELPKAAESLSFEVSKFTICFHAASPKFSTAQAVAELIFSATVVLCGSAKTSAHGSIRMVRDALHSTTGNVLDALDALAATLLAVDDASWKQAATKPTGVLWEACKQVQQVEFNNVKAFHVHMTRCTDTLKDVLEEMSELRQASSAGSSSSSSNSSNSSSSDDDQEDDEEALDPQEWATAQAAIELVKITKVMLHKCDKDVYSRFKTKADELDREQVQSLLQLLALAESINAHADEIGSSLYSPQDTDTIAASDAQMRADLVAWVELCNTHYPLDDSLLQLWQSVEKKLASA